jgi:2-oxoglutarate ferredoxin oxidoreductase subunit beta
MREQPINPLRKYIRNGKLPHFFCPGCGCGQVLGFFLKAVDELGYDLNNVVAIGGVGCTARIPVYLDTVALHGVHGRTLAWATGIKMHRPDLKVVIFAGDGDLASIGGNHFIHAARRNLDATVVMVNNLNFAMTGGQVAPTTPLETVTMTTPYGSEEPNFDVCDIARSAGATYVSRWTTNTPNQAIKSLKTALEHKGFSLVEIVSQCPTHFGRYALKSGKPEVEIEWIKNNTITLAKAKELTDEERQGKFIIGEFVNKQRPVYAGSTVCGME